MTPTSQHEPDFDLIVIGGGAVGENIADYATRGGARVALVESDLVGGECSYWACMPSKALLRSGHAVRAAWRVGGARAAITGELDADAVLSRRTSFTSGWDDSGQADWVDSAGITLLRGHARLSGRGRVQVGTDTLTAHAVALATGSVPVLPPIAGLAEAAPWGTREATSADTVPPRLIVIGGGVAGCELAFAWASLGSHVTLLARGGLVEREESFAGERVAAGLTGEGVDVRTGTTTSRVDRAADGTVTARLDSGEEITADEVLVATGRRPALDDVGLETAGVGEDFTVEDSMLVTGTDWLYAVGDVNGRAPLTHQGKYQARAAGAAIAARLRGAPAADEPWGAHVATADHTAVPRVIFTDPEVAAVGLTAAEARERGLRVRAVDVDLGQVAGASLHADDYTGQARLVVDEDRRVVVGATFVGQDVAELVHAATIAIVGEVGLDRLWHAVPAYPTMSEIWLRLLETYAHP
ncbi:dihydrolipoyl dehydrogenase family protein [Zhihengliuella flava]|uniref:Dihydrolipoamide dehydrogenase n=1 Tax=Zhihengliuella flava TaxID=1285193 RepID=A0A931D8R5_9MICC|nr:NAD(P)/FAD-dependent oxidoreductase [Zhihengliuella flava]MBG6084459.1 dihydrolipoamide dehydrogenase [Zhihengliuella flava]